MIVAQKHVLPYSWKAAVFNYQSGKKVLAALQMQFTQRDLGGNKLRKYLRTFHVPSELPQSTLDVSPSFPVELRDVALHSISPSGVASPAKKCQDVILSGREFMHLCKQAAKDLESPGYSLKPSSRPTYVNH